MDNLRQVSEELELCNLLTIQDLQAIVDHADKDCDGVLDEDEFVAAIMLEHADKFKSVDTDTRPRRGSEPSNPVSLESQRIRLGRNSNFQPEVAPAYSVATPPAYEQLATLRESQESVELDSPALTRGTAFVQLDSPAHTQGSTIVGGDMQIQGTAKVSPAIAGFKRQMARYEKQMSEHLAKERWEMAEVMKERIELLQKKIADAEESTCAASGEGGVVGV